jgi:hypothetical protein
VGNIAASSFSGGGFIGSNFTNESHADKTSSNSDTTDFTTKRVFIAQITP